MSARAILPARRMQLSRDVQLLGVDAVVSVGFELTISADGAQAGAVREVFVSTAKLGSEVSLQLEDGAVLTSLALQHGITIDSLTHSMARIPDGPIAPADLDRVDGTRPASLLGQLLEIVQEMASELEGEAA